MCYLSSLTSHVSGSVYHQLGKKKAIEIMHVHTAVGFSMQPTSRSTHTSRLLADIVKVSGRYSPPVLAPELYLTEDAVLFKEIL